MPVGAAACGWGGAGGRRMDGSVCRSSMTVGPVPVPVPVPMLESVALLPEGGGGDTLCGDVVPSEFAPAEPRLSSDSSPNPVPAPAPTSPAMWLRSGAAETDLTIRGAGTAKSHPLPAAAATAAAAAAPPPPAGPSPLVTALTGAPLRCCRV